MNEIIGIERTNLEELIVEYIIKYDRFITKLAYSVQRKCQKLEVDDIKQQIILYLLTRYKNFDVTLGTSSETYFSQIVINASFNIVKQYWQDKNRVYIEAVSLDNYIDENDCKDQFVSLVKEKEDSYYNPHTYVRRNEIYSYLSNVRQILTKFENKVFELYMDGKTVSEISSKCRKSKKTIYNTIAAIREKLKDINYL